MTSNSSEYTPQQYKKYNGQSVFKALGAIGNEASADELATFIAHDIGEREEIILPEIKQVLRRGIANGFLVRNGRLYSIVSDEPNMQVDSKKRRRTHSSSRSFKAPKRVVLSNRIAKRFEKEQEESDDEVTEGEGTEDEGSKADENEEEEDLEEMQTDSSARNRPKVKLYEIYNPSETESEDEVSEGEGNEPPQKRIRLRPNF